MMKKKIDWDSIDFNDPDDFAPDTYTCFNCVSETDERIGYNEKQDLLKRACSNCGIIYIEDSKCNITLLEGEMRDWKAYLSEHLTFPFKAKVDEMSDAEAFGRPVPLRYHDDVTVVGISGDFDMYGIVVDVKKGQKEYTFPLCDLAVVAKKSPNYKLVDDYRDWDCNYRDRLD